LYFQSAGGRSSVTVKMKLHLRAIIKTPYPMGADAGFGTTMPPHSFRMVKDARENLELVQSGLLRDGMLRHRSNLRLDRL
jgi:hypothetical protein